jgi:cytochrome oxidase Cu insertion factor (SCO1/SenC/PrrC family)
MRLKGPQLDGTPFDLDTLRGQVTLVFFWTTRSSVARDELPEVRRNFEGWRGKGFHLVTVSDDMQLQDALDYERAVGLSMSAQNRQLQRFPRLWRREPGYSDSFGTLREYPVSFLVGRNGTVAKAFKGRLGNAGWDEIAEVLLT